MIYCLLHVGEPSLVACNIGFSALLSSPPFPTYSVSPSCVHLCRCHLSRLSCLPCSAHMWRKKQIPHALRVEAGTSVTDMFETGLAAGRLQEDRATAFCTAALPPPPSPPPALPQLPPLPSRDTSTSTCTTLHTPHFYRHHAFVVPHLNICSSYNIKTDFFFCSCRGSGWDLDLNMCGWHASF